MELSEGATELYNLIKCRHVSHAAKHTARHGVWLEWIVGIGKDEVAYITMTEEAFNALESSLHPTST